MQVYLLKVSFVIAIALLFYKAVLQQESFFSTNRLYFIGCVVLAFALPFVSLPRLISHQGYLSAVFQPNTAPQTRVKEQPVEGAALKAVARVQAKEQLRARPAPETVPDRVEEKAATPETQNLAFHTDWLFWLAMLYLFGVAVFTLNLLVQVGSLLYKALRSTDRIDDDDCVIVSMGSRQAPCSFFRYIFIYPDDYDFETYGQIIAHEKIHVRQGHSFDLLLAELAVIVLWFNPLIWLYKREVEKNIEYQTDAILLEREQVNKNQYQLNLLQIACPNKPLSITTNYNQSLLKQRILKMNAKKSTLHSYWKYTFLAPLFFGTLLFMNAPATSRELTGKSILLNMTQQDNEGQGDEKAKAGKEKDKRAKPGKEKVKEKAKQVYSINISGQDTDMSQGYWYSHQEGDQYCLELKGSRSSSNWNISRCFDKKLFQKKGNAVFVLTKETGTLQLTGALDAEVSQGKYTFTEDASFRKYLAANKIESDEKNFMFHLFLGDVDKQYVSYLKQQYNDLEGERLMELAIHGVSRDEYQRYASLFQKYSNKKPSIEEVISARIHGIDEAYVKEIQAMGYNNLSMDKMMEARIHGVNSAYVEGLRKAGFDNLPIDKVIEAKIHGIKPANAAEMQNLGFGKLPLDKIIELKIHGVTEAYIAELKAAGFDKLPLDDIVSAKIHGMNGASIKEIQALGFKDLDFEEMVAAKIHGVNAAYIADLKSAGLQNLSIDEAVAAKIHGIDSDFIKKAKQEGYNLKSVDEYVTLKIHGMALKSLKEKN